MVLFGSGTGGAAVAPRTCGLLRRYCRDAVELAQEGGGEVIFSVLAPKTRIKAHCATANIRLTG
eukprot:CAMPEP_0172504878 /NCGR_PEP_ID=MMETSP1066-20121228/181967_1 /TAXON_ID=671091 /ORGANISM="Coscinodiscus wailesii, Strain CCMP2513" /LENGTH=63 /DNA_ID=CAMNT_0013281255 /DNA_START=1 /DNA_END=188 /DNA_ORIENTATION=+